MIQPASRLDVTAHDFAVTADDIARLGPGTESEWFVAHTNPRAEYRALAGLREIGIPAYTPSETRWRGRGPTRRAVQSPVLMGYVFFLLREGRSFWEVRRIDGVHDVLFGLNGKPGAIPHRDVARLARKEADGKFDHTRNAKEARKETERLKANLGDLQALGWKAASDLLMEALDPPAVMDFDEAA